MERGVYFDAWFPRQHCYHPSLPPRRLRMVDHLEDYQATVLIWSALGGGSLSLPYLEQEAYGAVDARSRFYGFVNDSEFIRACQEKGIKVFGIVFEAQGWEFPVELNDDEDAVLALNEERGVGRSDWMGLREFTQNRYPKLWDPFEKYFPDGLKNSDGEPVTDLLEECCSRDIHQVACHAHWVECPDRNHYCYYMDRNNPVWREYLKAVIRIQIDAGVDGVQLDEAELPMGAMRYGGCFCKDCMKGFRAHLQEAVKARDIVELEGADLETFHYGDWLLERGHDFKTQRAQAPLFWEYHRFQRSAVKRYFSELAHYAREYAAAQGREVLVSGNFFNLYPHYHACVPDVDIVITEMRNTRYRQPAWYRYVSGFSGDRSVVVAENPYGGVIPELVEQLSHGRGYDLYRLSLYEAAAHGCNMSAPYGSWMGSRIEDAFYAPHDVTMEVQKFLADSEALLSRSTHHDTAVVFSIESNHELVARRDAFADIVENVTDKQVHVPFWDVSEELADAGEPYDVIVFPDGLLHPDDVQVESLERYRTIVLPGCSYLTSQQAAAVLAYLDRGGSVVVLGDLGTNLDADEREKLVGHDGVRRVEDTSVATILGGHRQVDVEPASDVSVTLQRLDDGAAAVHIVNYAYSLDHDRIEPIKDLRLTVSVPGRPTTATLHAPGRPPADIPVETDGGRHRLAIDELGIYGVVVFAGDATT